MPKIHLLKEIQKVISTIAEPLKGRTPGLEVRKIMTLATVACIDAAYPDAITFEVDYALNITAVAHRINLNLNPITENGLAFFKMHRMCPRNMELIPIGSVDLSKVRI